MNKKVIALAVAGALVAPLAAHADAQIYGQMHVSIDAINNDNSAADDDSGMGVSSNSSRIGFKGSEDLGGGMSAVWQVESSIGLTDNAQTSLAGRNSFLGLAGGFGTVLVGRHDTPYKSVGRAVDFFGDTAGDSRTIINDNGQHARPGNVIAYVSPNFSGFQGVAAYVTDLASDRSDDTDNQAYSLALNYNNGPLYVGLATQNLSEDALGTADDAVAHMVAASYTFGSFKVGGLYQRDASYGGDDDADRNTWGIGGAFNMGANTIKAQYYYADEIDGTDDTEVGKFAIGFDHAMSKQTKVYALYARVDNGDNSAVNVAGVNGDGFGDTGPGCVGGVCTEAGGEPSAFSVGMIHKF